MASIPQEWLANLPAGVGKPAVQVAPLASVFKFASSDSGGIYIADQQERDAFQKVKFPSVHGLCLGQRRVAVIASRDVTADRISRDELTNVMQNGVLGRQRIETIFVESEPYVQRVLQARLQECAESKGGIRVIASPKSDLIRVTTRADILQAMRNARGCIGLVSLPLAGLEKEPKHLKLLDESSKVIDHDSDIGDYWLSETLFAYVHKSASLDGELLMRALLCGEGQAFLAAQGLLTPKAILDARAEVRALDVKAGKGVRLTGLGISTGKRAMADLVTEYVRAKAVVQPSYAAVDADVSSIGAFVNGEGASVRELLLLGDKLSARALELHGEKWNALGPDGTGPVEYTLAGRAVAIIVNPANKLESLTLGQIQAIFGGEVDDWSVIGGTGLAAPVGPDGKAEDIPIHAFGLHSREPATKVFEKECLVRRKWRRVKIKKDTAAAVAAVSTDPRAIAFVDLTAIPGIGPASLAGDFAAAGQNVKVLAIKFGMGEKAKIIQPTAENIKNAMYPLSQRLFLYVHPKASDTAKDFAKFIATCGGSEATPYADTVKAVMETYLKHGLIPLADAAIERVTKDAMAAAAAKAKAEAPKPKGKR